MQFGGVIYLHDLSQPRDVEKVMTPLKLSDPEIALRVILATVDGNGLNAKARENRLNATISPELKTLQFTNTKDSAWSIVDAILGISPTGIKLFYIQDELDKVYDSLSKNVKKRKKFFLFGKR